MLMPENKEKSMQDIYLKNLLTCIQISLLFKYRYPTKINKDKTHAPMPILKEISKLYISKTHPHKYRLTSSKDTSSDVLCLLCATSFLSSSSSEESSPEDSSPPASSGSVNTIYFILCNELIH